MKHPRDPRIDDAKLIPMTEVIDRLGIGNLRKTGCELVGPCPCCGGRDRFGINLRTNLFQCRKCDLKGGDQIALARGVLGMKFCEKDPRTGHLSYPVLDWLCGNDPAVVDQAVIERRRKAAQRAEAKQRAQSDRYRRRAIADARSIWDRSRPGAQGVVRAYLTARGIPPEALPVLPEALRFIVAHPYVKRMDGELVTAHTGPCMIACILNAEGQLTAVHQTWVSNDPPHGKARILHHGEIIASKLVRGSKKGGAIRLLTPPGANTLIMGEGIETTLSAMVAQGVPGAAYWAGVDLGNMAGRMKGRNSGLPDLEDAEAFVPPPWVRRLIYIQDGDSDPRSTRAKLVCGIRRAMALRPGLKGQIVHPGEGVDLNDVLVRGESEPDGEGDPA